MPREDTTTRHPLTDARESGFRKRTSANWEDNPLNIQEALERIGEGKCGVVQIVASGDPASPATGGSWLDQTGTVAVAGQIANITAVTANYTILGTDSFVTADCTSGDVTLTLPTSADVNGKLLWIMRIDGSSNVVNIDGNASETINGDTVKSFFRQWEGGAFLATGGNWLVPLGPGSG